MVPGADRDVAFVEDRAEVVGVDVVQREADDPGAALGAEQRHVIHRPELTAQASHKYLFMRMNSFRPDGGDVVRRSGEGDGFGDRRRARLEPLRPAGVGGPGEGHAVDHRPAALIGRHVGEDVRARPQRPDPGRAVELVGRKDVEIACQRHDIDLHMRRGLAPVEQQLRAHLVRQRGGARGIEHAACDVGDVPQRDQLVALCQHGLGRIEVDPVIRRQRAHVDVGTHLFRNHLPRHDVRMVLGLREQDAVACLEVRPAPRLREKVDRLGRAAGEDELVLVPSDEPRHRPPRRLVGERHLGRAGVDPAVDGRVILAQRAGHGVNHGARLLRGGGGVEVVPGLALMGDHAGEVCAQVAGDGGGGVHSLAPSSAASSNVSRSASSSSATKASPMKACTSSRCAVAGSSPRAIM